jgi:hypothetical protein
MTVEVLLDGKMIKEVKIGPKDLFTFENTALVLGDGVLTGNHTVELRKKGTGPLYFNAYLTVFTLETPIKKAGLEVKINRKYYLLKKSATEVKVPGARGEAVNQRGEKYERSEIQDLASVKSGDLVEIEMEILSKNDYEYILIEDMKAAGFEPVELRSGYGNLVRLSANITTPSTVATSEWKLSLLQCNSAFCLLPNFGLATANYERRNHRSGDH